MPQLYLIRHAESDWQDHSISDFDRPLNNKGESDALNMAEMFAKENVKVDMLVSSTAQRALSTATYFINSLNVNEDSCQYDPRIYNNDLYELLDICAELTEDIETAVLIGHNPSFSMLANYLLGENSIELPTASIIGLNMSSSWRNLSMGCAKKNYYATPRACNLD